MGRPKIKHETIDGVIGKVCSTCKVHTPLDEFSKQSQRWDGKDSRCKKCLTATRRPYADYNKAYHEANKDKINERRKEIRVEDPERFRQYNKNDYEKRKPEIIKKTIERHKERYHSDPAYKLVALLRARTHDCIKKGWNGKRALFGADIEVVKKHLEDQWVEGMSWDNWTHDGWHVDHIKPLASFDMNNPDEVKKAFHYTNIQPLWAVDNLRKGDKIYAA